MARDDFKLADFLPSGERAFVAMALSLSYKPARVGAETLMQVLIWQIRTMPLWLVALAQEAHNAACALEHQGEWQIGLRKIRPSDKFELTPLNVGLEIIEADAFVLRDLLERCRLGRAADPSAHWPHWVVGVVMRYRQRLLDALVESVGELAEDGMSAQAALERLAYLNLGWVVTLGNNDETDFVNRAWQAGEYRRENRSGNGPTHRTRLIRQWVQESPFQPNPLVLF